jgi:hypothetical protein
VAAFVHDKVGVIDEKKPAVRREGVGEERYIKDEPTSQLWIRDRLPGRVELKFIEKGLQVFAHG